MKYTLIHHSFCNGLQAIKKYLYLFNFHSYYLLVDTEILNFHIFAMKKILTKSFLIEIIKDKPKYSEYLPDNVKLENISKDYLFSVNR